MIVATNKGKMPFNEIAECWESVRYGGTVISRRIAKVENGELVVLRQATCPYKFVIARNEAISACSARERGLLRRKASSQ